jgi:hypothetical protein
MRSRFVSRDTLGTRATGLKSMVYTYVSKRKLLIWNEFGVITSKIPRSEGRNPELHMLVRSILKFREIYSLWINSQYSSKYTGITVRNGSGWKLLYPKIVLRCMEHFFLSLFLSCWLLWSYWSQQKRKLDRMIELESGFLLVALCMCVGYPLEGNQEDGSFTYNCFDK